MVKGLKELSQASKCKFQRPEINDKEGPHEIEF